MSSSNNDFKGTKVKVGSSTVTVGNKIAAGSEGAVYHIAGTDDSVVKIFHGQTRKEKADKVRAMIGNEPEDPTYDERGVRSIIWPQEVVEDPKSGEFLGYEMPYKDLSEAVNAFQYSIQELDWNESTEEERLTTAKNLAIMVGHVHDAGHAIGDFNHDNILIANGIISLIDCDAFHVTDGNTTYPDYTWYPRYAPPEGRPETDKVREVQEADRFCLGVHVFHFLVEGNHPYQAKGPKAVGGSPEDMIQGNEFPYENTGYEPPEDALKKYEQLPTEVTRLFAQCFSESGKEGEGLLYGDARPAPSEWRRAFNQVLGETTTAEPKDGEDEKDEGPDNVYGSKDGTGDTNTTDTGHGTTNDTRTGGGTATNTGTGDSGTDPTPSPPGRGEDGREDVYGADGNAGTSTNTDPMSSPPGDGDNDLPGDVYGADGDTATSTNTDPTSSTPGGGDNDLPDDVYGGNGDTGTSTNTDPTSSPPEDGDNDLPDDVYGGNGDTGTSTDTDSQTNGNGDDELQDVYVDEDAGGGSEDDEDDD